MGIQAATSSHHCLSLCLFPATLTSYEAPEKSSQCNCCQSVTHSPLSLLLHKPDRPLYISGHGSGFSGHYKCGAFQNFLQFFFVPFEPQAHKQDAGLTLPWGGCGALSLADTSLSLSTTFAHKAYYIQLRTNSSHEWALGILSVKLGSKSSSCPWGGAHGRLSFDYVLLQHQKGALVGPLDGPAVS